MKEFNDKVALVTGGSSGIGRQTALVFAQKGAKVVIASRRFKESEETVQLIKNSGSEGIFIQTDVTQANEIQYLINQIVDTYGRLDYAFNNAGTEGIIGRAIDQTEDNWNHIIETNLKGVWLSMKYEIPQMIKQGGGAIVNNASVAGLIGIRENAIYCASKHGVVGLTKALALEHATDGLRINAVCPGSVNTDMLKRTLVRQENVDGPQYRSQMLSRKMIFAGEHPMKRIGQPEEVAKAVVWLCSEDSTFVTGQSLAIDGGFTAQ